MIKVIVDNATPIDGAISFNDYVSSVFYTSIEKKGNMCNLNFQISLNGTSEWIWYEQNEIGELPIGARPNHDILINTTTRYGTFIVVVISKSGAIRVQPFSGITQNSVIAISTSYFSD